ncbi:MAG: hypothetical protein HOW73_18125 [Polyangiaceae bacterium]|nr:hypothetical protein [Polyangiaceae bacterium]
MRTFVGTKDDGTPFTILYTPSGVKWIHGDGGLLSRSPSPTPERSRGEDEPTSSASVAAALDAAAGVVGAAAQLVNAVTRVLEWWEKRKLVQIEESRFEEERRIPWTYEMIRRWVFAHKDGDSLDLDISHYLGREAYATLSAIAENKKMAVPQAMLYELEQIRRVVASQRVLLGRQFRALARAERFNACAIIRESLLKQPEVPITINYENIERWAGDPAVDWERCVMKGELKSFEQEFRDMSRFPMRMVELAFGYRTDPKAPPPERSGTVLDGSSPFWLAIGLASSKLVNPYVLLANALVPAATYVYDFIKESDALRRDDFRELALYAAEVERVRLLHRLWCTVDGGVRQKLGGGLLVTEDHGALRLAAPVVKGEYEIISELALFGGASDARAG